MDIADLSALLGEDVTASTAADVWVVLPGNGAGPLPAGDLALVGEARRLADGLGCYVHAVISNSEAAEPTIAAGADRAHITLDPEGYLAGQQPEFILLPAHHNALAAALAQRFQAGLITDVRGPLTVEADTRTLLAPHPVYGADYFLDLAVTSAIKLATLDTTGLIAPPADASRSGEVIQSDLPATLERWHDLGPADYQPPQWRPLSKARAIVAAGRGLRDADGLALAAELARILGAELAGDRSARDSDWVDEAHQVGVTAQEVAPELYVAVGVLGDTVHNAAMTGARRVVAIHANPGAPIFSVADLGLVAEPKEVLPELIAALRR
jgi:electron transfer flavoprotein alpha subunit